MLSAFSLWEVSERLYFECRTMYVLFYRLIDVHRFNTGFQQHRELDKVIRETGVATRDKVTGRWECTFAGDGRDLYCHHISCHFGKSTKSSLMWFHHANTSLLDSVEVAVCRSKEMFFLVVSWEVSSIIKSSTVKSLHRSRGFCGAQVGGPDCIQTRCPFLSCPSCRSSAFLRFWQNAWWWGCSSLPAYKVW